MLVKIYLHGHLRDKIKKTFVEIEASTVMDALQGLANIYKKELKAPLDIGRWKVRVKDYEIKENWYVPLMENELHLYPVFRTAKSNWLQIGIGVVLMVVGYVGGAFTGGASLSLAKVGAMMAFSAGMSLTVSGIVGLLYPTPNLSSSKPKDSKYLGAQGNTIDAGTRIPFGYGIYKVSGHFISYNVSTTVVRETY